MQDRGHMNHKDTREALLRAVAGRDASAQLPVVARTRRAIRVANESRREQGERGRHGIGVTLFVLGAIFVVLAPAMWGSLDDFFGGEHFGDLPTQITLLSTFLMLAVVGALVVVWRNRVANQDEYRQDH
jgi:protein-S-isoprenylcysteine O-methyltransferase Ste14